MEEPNSNKNKSFSYAEHLNVIKTIRRQLKDSDERFERSLSKDSGRRQLFKKSYSFSSQALKTVNCFNQDEFGATFDNPHEDIFTERSRDKSTIISRGYKTFYQNDFNDAEETKTDDPLEVESSFEYLKSIRKTEMFKSDKERIEFLVSEIEILNKRIMILEYEISGLRKSKDNAPESAKKVKLSTNKSPSSSREQKLEIELNAAKKLMLKMIHSPDNNPNKDYEKTRLEERVKVYQEEMSRMQEIHSKDLSNAKKNFEEMKKKSICYELQNNLLNEKVKSLQEQLANSEKEKQAMKIQMQKQNETITEQAKTLERFKKEIIEKYVKQANLNPAS